MVAIRDVTGLALVPLDGSAQRTRLPVSNVADFAFVGDELWVADGGMLRRFTRGGAEHGPAYPLADAAGELLTAFDASGRTALWRSSAETLLLAADADNLEAEDVAAELEHASYVSLLGGRRVICARNGSASIRDLGRGEIEAYPLSGRLCAAASILGGRTLAMLVETEGAGRLSVVLSGKLVHKIEVPRPDLVAIAHRRGQVAVCDGASLVFVDARLGRITSSVRPPFPVLDLGMDANAAHAILAGMVDGQLAVLDVSPNDQAESAKTVDSVPNVHVAAAPPSPGEVAIGGDIPNIVAPEVAFRSFEPSTSAPADEHRQAVMATVLLDEAVCHAALLLERLLFLNRNLGLLPRTTTGDDVLGAVSNDSDVAIILDGFRKIRGTPPPDRRALLPDPFLERVAESRAALREILASPRAAEVGLARIVHAFSLSDTALDLLVLAFAPEWDLRLGRLCAYLNNDARQHRPLFGQLLMTAQRGLPSLDAEVLAAIRRDLLEPGLLEIQTAPAGTPLKLRIVRPVELLVELGAMAALRARRDAKGWDELRWKHDDRDRMRSALRREIHRAGERRLILLEGPPGSGRMAMACATALDVGTGFELCSLAPPNGDEFAQLERELSRTAYRAKLTGSVLAVRGDNVLAKWPGFLQYLEQLARKLDIACFVTVRKDELAAVTDHLKFIRFEPPRLEPAERRELWKEHLDARGLFATESTIDDITARYSITPGRLVDLADELRIRQAWRQTAIVEIGDVLETLRDLTVHKLGSGAKRYRSSMRLSDLILHDNVRDRLAELVHRLRYRQRVLGGWGFADKAHESYGVSTLFSGPPGTGKTAAAVAVANELEIDLYVVDFSGVMSKWVGETEQNLARIFDEAEASSVALLFDEADALFGKRSNEQGSASDRYANLTVNYLLQRMENYAGLAILTTNLEAAMDDAFQRRITTRVKFPPADDAQRQELWRHLIPKGARYADDVDLAHLSQLLRMEGAHIRRALTRAAFRAASRGQAEPVLTRADLIWAATAEYEDMGRLTFNAEGRPDGLSSLGGPTRQSD